MPRAPGNFSLEDLSSYPPRTVARMKAFGGERSPVYYDEILQTAHHIHFPADGNHRLLQHYYGERLLGVCVCLLHIVVVNAFGTAVGYLDIHIDNGFFLATLFKSDV